MVVAMSENEGESAREQYWLVYLYKYDRQQENGFLWQPVGLVEDRTEWQDWWERVMKGEVELPFPFGGEGWWCSDRPVRVGLPDYEDREDTEEWEPKEGVNDA